MKLDNIGISETVTFLATCVTVRRKDGVVMGFTDHAHDITIGDITYEAKSGYSAAAIAQSEGLSVDNTEIEGALKSDAITEYDLTTGKYDYAEIEIFQINYHDPSAGKRILKAGYIGEITRGDFTFKTEIRGLGEMAQRKIGELYSETCRTDFCDGRCKLNVVDYTAKAEVVAVDSDGSIIFAITKEDDYYTGGLMTGITGANEGVSMDIAEQKGQNIIPFLTLPYPIKTGDEWSLLAGCDHTFNTCSKKFGNYLNFRGEPNIPGADKVISYPIHK